MLLIQCTIVLGKKTGMQMVCPDSVLATIDQNRVILRKLLMYHVNLHCVQWPHLELNQQRQNVSSSCSAKVQQLVSAEISALP